MIDPAVGAMLAGAFALLFVSAALDKLRSLQRFAEVFRAYRLLPDGAACGLERDRLLDCFFVAGMHRR